MAIETSEICEYCGMPLDGCICTDFDEDDEDEDEDAEEDI